MPREIHCGREGDHAIDQADLAAPLAQHGLCCSEEVAFWVRAALDKVEGSDLVDLDVVTETLGHWGIVDALNRDDDGFCGAIGCGHNKIFGVSLGLQRVEVAVGCVGPGTVFGDLELTKLARALVGLNSG